MVTPAWRWTFSTPKYRQRVILETFAKYPELWWNLRNIEQALNISRILLTPTMLELIEYQLIEQDSRTFPGERTERAGFKITNAGLAFLGQLKSK